MKRFENEIRVVVTDKSHALHGMGGTVKRLRMGDNGAWVAMDGPVPDELRYFPSDDIHARGNHVLLYPEECDPLFTGIAKE